MFFAYALVDANKTLLFVNESQLDDSVRQHLGSEVEIHPYDSFFSFLTHRGAELAAKKSSVCTASLYLPRIYSQYRAYGHLAENPRERQGKPRSGRGDREGMSSHYS